MTTSLDRRFFESTRGQMVTLLRRGRLTVDELASAVGLTNNGVRAHLATLSGTVSSGIVARWVPPAAAANPPTSTN